MRVFACTASILCAAGALAAFGPGASAQTLQSRAEKWHCDVVTTYSCQPEGCEPASFDPIASDPNAADIDIDFVTRKYERPPWTVQTFKPRVEGGLTVFLLPDDTVYALVNNDGSDFLEVRSNGYWSMTSFGSCTPKE